MDEDTLEMPSVWKIVDSELHRRRLKWPALCRHLGIPEKSLHQTIINWEKRGIPTRHYLGIAAFLGWSVERMTGHAPEPQSPPAPPEPEPAYTKRANDIAKAFDELRDNHVRQQAYALVMGQLQMAKAGQRVAEPAPPPEPPPPPPPPPPTAPPTPKTHSPEPAPKKKPRRGR